VTGIPCYLLLAGDDPANASFCESVSDAKDLFVRVNLGARSMRFATLHFVEKQGDDFDPAKPNRWLRLDPGRTLTEAGYPLKEKS
jgi:hypothetical protein